MSFDDAFDRTMDAAAAANDWARLLRLGMTLRFEDPLAAAREVAQQCDFPLLGQGAWLDEQLRRFIEGREVIADHSHLSWLPIEHATLAISRLYPAIVALPSAGQLPVAAVSATLAEGFSASGAAAALAVEIGDVALSGTIWLLTGHGYANSGNLASGVEAYLEAVESLLALPERDRDLHVHLMMSARFHLGASLASAKLFDEAEEELKTSLNMALSLVEADDSGYGHPEAYAPVVAAGALSNLGYLAEVRGDMSSALEMTQAAHEMLQRMDSLEPGVAKEWRLKVRMQLARLATNLGDVSKGGREFEACLNELPSASAALGMEGLLMEARTLVQVAVSKSLLQKPDEAFWTLVETRARISDLPKDVSQELQLLAFQIDVLLAEYCIASELIGFGAELVQNLHCAVESDMRGSRAIFDWSHRSTVMYLQARLSLASDNPELAEGQLRNAESRLGETSARPSVYIRCLAARIRLQLAQVLFANAFAFRSLVRPAQLELAASSALRAEQTLPDLDGADVQTANLSREVKASCLALRGIVAGIEGRESDFQRLFAEFEAFVDGAENPAEICLRVIGVDFVATTLERIASRKANSHESVELARRLLVRASDCAVELSPTAQSVAAQRSYTNSLETLNEALLGVLSLEWERLRRHASSKVRRALAVVMFGRADISRGRRLNADLLQRHRLASASSDASMNAWLAFRAADDGLFRKGRRTSGSEHLDQIVFGPRTVGDQEKTYETPRFPSGPSEQNLDAMLAAAQSAALSYSRWVAETSKLPQLTEQARCSIDRVGPDDLAELLQRDYLDSSTMILHYTVLADKGLAILISCEAIEAVSLPHGGWIEQANSKSAWLSGGGWSATDRGGREEDWDRDLSRQLSWLSQVFVKPLVGRIGRGIRRIVIVPHRALHLVPFQAMPLNDGSLLGDQYEINYAPSARAWRLIQDRVRNAAETSERFVLAMPRAGDLAYRQVDAAAIRAAAASSGAPCELLGPGECQKQKIFKALASSTTFHFAGHASSNIGDPERTELTLDERNDGAETLTARELIYNLTISQCSLVVLGACETGMYVPSKRSDFFGLPSILLAAGARMVISSLWQVDDLATTLLFNRFYAEYGHGASAGLALHRAQLWLRGKASESVAGLADGAAVRKYIEDTGILDRLERLPRAQLSRQLDDLVAKYPSSAPFEHPTYWAAFTATGVS